MDTNTKSTMQGHTARTQKPGIEALTEHLHDTKVGQQHDAAMESLADGLSQKWSPEATHGDKPGTEQGGALESLFNAVHKKWTPSSDFHRYGDEIGHFESDHAFTY